MEGSPLRADGWRCCVLRLKKFCKVQPEHKNMAAWEVKGPEVAPRGPERSERVTRRKDVGLEKMEKMSGD